MDLKEIFGVIGFALTILSGIVYCTSILQGKTKPHLFTRLVFGILEGIVFSGQLVSGGGLGAWVTGLSALFSAAIVILSLKYGTKDVTRGDMYFFSLALVCIVVWLLMKDPLWSVLLAAAIDVAAIIPTYRKTWFAPESESLLSWYLGTAKFLFAIFALSTVSFVTVIYPIEVIMVNSILIAIIWHRKKFV